MTLTATIEAAVAHGQAEVGPDAPETWEAIRSIGGAGKPAHVHEGNEIVYFEGRDGVVIAKRKV